MAKRRAYYVLSTHWDREWYSSFQDFRYRLVGLMDRIIAGIQAGTLKGPFQTDGAAMLVEDYLEIHPERRELIMDLARRGLLRIGPWFVLPDEWTVSGESLIRNLRLGCEVARSLGGEPSRVGFACDMFGHNSQLPQILAGFGIATGYIWRGTNLPDKRHVIWRGADGTELVCYRFGAVGYCTFATQVRKCGEHGKSKLDPAQFAEDLTKFLDAEAATSDTDSILIFDGGDHLEWDPQAYELMTQQMSSPDCPFELVHLGLDEYSQQMVAQKDRMTTRLEGELREPGLFSGEKDQQWLIPGVYSSRVNLKLANRLCETLLCQWAEPFCALADLAVGAAPAPGFLATAWRWLLTNHPHDSIDGCSIDQAHKDMEYRFDQARMIAERLTRQTTLSLAANVEGELAKENLRLAVFNPMPRTFDGVAELTVELPTKWPSFQEFFHFEAKPAFRIFGPDGTEIPYQRLHQAMNRTKVRTRQRKYPEGYGTNDVRVALPLSVPAMGYAALEVRPAKGNGNVARHPDRPGMATSECSMANEHLAVTINPNGSLDLTNRVNGQAYRGLMVFEDCADIGDGWYHGVAVNDQAYVSTACRADVAMVSDGPMQTSFRVTTVMRVPDHFDSPSMSRSEDLAELTIDSVITLRAGADYLQVRTTVDNVARDHRLRVLMPSGAATDTYLADSQFDVIRRPIALRADNHLYRELEVETKPQQSWAAVHDNARGLAVVAGGLLESAVRDLPARPIALTLLRATVRTVMTNGEPGGQLQGSHSFDYRIMPLAGTPDVTRLCEMGQEVTAGLRSLTIQPADVKIHAADAKLPAKAGLLRLEGQAVITSTRQVGATLEVRLFNPTEQPVKARLVLGELATRSGRFSKAAMVDFQSIVLEPAKPISGETVGVSLNAKQIKTIQLS